MDKEYIHYVNESENYAEIEAQNRELEQYERLCRCHNCMDKSETTLVEGKLSCDNCLDKEGEHIQFLLSEIEVISESMTSEEKDDLIALYGKEHPELTCYEIMIQTPVTVSFFMLKINLLNQR